MKTTQWMPRFCAQIITVLLVALTSLSSANAADPNQGPGGPILVITSGTATFGKYYAEILRNEGFNEFAVADLATVSATTLAAYDVAILAPAALSASQATLLANWVSSGGNLIAMRPDPQLYGLLGLTSTGSTLANAYLRFDTSKQPGNGLVGETIQFHGSASLYGLTGGSTSLATLYANATTATGNPAATLRNVGANGGQAAAFAYDLATSVVYSRQGNPAWATQERDGFTPIRSDDKFFGAASADPQPDWVDLTKAAIPQADEQQRFLANLIIQMNLDKKPLPRFWYFPRAKKAVVVMTGDDHRNGGTAGRFDQFIAASPAGCSVANWECVRGTSYVYPGTSIANFASYNTAGFEIGLHVNTNCADFTSTSLDNFYSTQISQWTSSYPGLPAPITERHHCLVWSDWISGANIELKYGIRLDTSYYYWPPGWVQNRPGFFTGSGMPMRFMNLNGAFVDVYKAATQMTDESGQTYPFTIDSLLDRAVGATGYYGAFVINAHTDFNPNTQANATITSAQARGVPIVSSRQMLQWLDGRNDSAFSALSWNGNVLNFTVTPGTGANGLQVLLPAQSSSGALTGLTRGGTAVPFTLESIKGISYASFLASGGGAFVAAYAQDTTAPTVTATSPANGATGVSAAAVVTATFSKAIDPATLNGNTFTLQGPNGSVAAAVSYDAGTRTATLTPNAVLAFGTTYTAAVKGGTTDPRVKDSFGNALANTVTWSFATGSGPSCPCSAWSSTAVPTRPADPDTGSVNLGVKFRSDFDGFITGIRFYKGSTNTGTHVGTLWTGTGQLLGQATFANETASGWQQVNFATPVAITANTVYVASYHAPNGHYASDNNYFATGVDNPPLHLLANGVSGGNGVYAYNANPVFPNSTFQGTNYWVDVVFALGSGPGPTPTLTSIAVTPTTATIAVGATQAYTATGTYSDGSTQNLTGQVTWTSSNPAVAAISSAGLATAQSTGTTTFSAALSGVTGTATLTVQTAGSACTSPANAIVAENCLPGNPKSEWDVSGAGDATIQGFATDISFNKGATVNFKIKTTASNYRLDIYRMGYYGGLGARKVATVNPSAALPQNQPNCLNNAATGLIDCGNWAVSASWPVPANAASGIYFAKAVRTDTGGASHIVFIVRDDAGSSNVLFQTSDTTWHAYNTYGGNSLYTGSPAGRAYKVSYNRPFNTRSVDNGQDWLFNAEYPMVRWLEANGFDVSYFTDVDSDRRGTLIRNHKVFLSVGHDEYWSGAQRANVEAARGNGIHLAFFSGNEVFWKTRWENSIDGSNTAHRTLVCYKETHANQVIDPADPPTWTGTWRDPRFSPPADGGRPENALTGTIFMVNDGATTSIQVPSADGKMRFWRNTAIANLASGSVATLPFGTLGYEADADLDNGFRPAGLVRMSTTTLVNAPVLQDYGSTYGSGTVTHHLTLYRDSTSRALVFGAGTMQWSWGLDSNHDRGSAAPNISMQQATVNLLADMGVQPATLQTGLTAATASTDTSAPTSAITSPAANASLPAGSPATITGTATDTGGGTVGGVEVSADGGATWHPASGRATWSYNWTPSSSGTVTIKSRAVDDSGNLETPGAGVSVTVGSGGGTTCTANCTIFAATVPGTVDGGPDSPVELGVKFRSDVGGTITGIRFYKASANTGTHVGNLWPGSGGAPLASATFINETASGWQQVNFPTPVTIAANTVYVASYHANAGHYSQDLNYFASQGADNAPLHALANGVSGFNGVYAYGTGSIFPTQGFNSSNYWVDVVFNPGSAPTDTTTPTVSITAPAAGSTVSGTVTVTATASDNVGVTGVQFLLDGAPLGAEDTAAPYSASWDTTAAANGTHTLSARARDAANNQGTAANLTLTVDNAGSPTDTIAPTVSITAPAAGSTVSGTVTVTATASDNVGVTGVQFLLDGAPLGAEDTAAPYSVSWDTTAATNGTHTLSARARDAANNQGTAANLTLTVDNAGSQPLPSPWVDQDIGSVGVAGSASHANGTFTVAGSGSDIWGTSDSGHFAYQPLQGDGTITARLASIQNTGVWAKAGLMIRETLAANARNAMILLNPQQGVWFQFRSASGGTTQEIFGGAGLPPRWIRLQRSGTTFTAFRSDDGTTWTTVGTTTVSMASSVYIGLAVSSFNNAALNTSLFDNVTVAAP
jgi:regulation of enolase protein 1 (concanavalin A-like superfamily)